MTYYSSRNSAEEAAARNCLLIKVQRGFRQQTTIISGEPFTAVCNNRYRDLSEKRERRGKKKNGKLINGEGQRVTEAASRVSQTGPAPPRVRSRTRPARLAADGSPAPAKSRDRILGRCAFDAKRGLVQSRRTGHPSSVAFERVPRSSRRTGPAERKTRGQRKGRVSR